MPPTSIPLAPRDISSPTSTPHPLLKPQLIGTLTATILYGLVISLALHTLQPLIFHAKQRTYSNRMRWFLIMYTIVMWLLSTGAFSQTVWFAMRVFFGGGGGGGGGELDTRMLIEGNSPLVLPLTVWGADGVMIWRCIILYGNASRMHHIIIYCSLIIFSIISFSSGVLFYILPFLPKFTSTSPSPPDPHIPGMLTISVTVLVNIFLTTLIVGRLLTHQSSIRRVLGPQYGSPYLRLVVILVESCGFIVLTGIAYLILFVCGKKDGTIVPLLMLPQICVLSPLVIVYAVGKGKATHEPSHPEASNVLEPRRAVTRQYRTSLISHSIAFMEPDVNHETLDNQDSKLSSNTGLQREETSAREEI